MSKIQIRQGTFETNSSTQHALVIKCYNKEHTIPENANLPKEVTLRFIDWQESVDIDSKLNIFENRVLYLYSSLIKRSEYENPIDLINFLSVLQKIGIKYTIVPIPEDTSLYIESLPNEFIDDLMQDETTLINYIYAKDILYDCYEDDYGTYEQQCEWDKTIKAFSKNGETITLNCRC